MADALLSVRDLQTTFFTKQGPCRAVNGVSYDIARGQTLGVVGESGCGKTVTAYSIMGLVEHPGKVSGGQILFEGTDLLSLSARKQQALRGHQIAMIFQEPMTALNPVLTVGYQLDEPMRHHLGMGKAQARARSVELLGRTGIPSPQEAYQTYPHQLSGGMRQRAMIAMALACKPKLLIADEPTTALDVTVQAQILELLGSLQKEFEMAIQFITHDLGVIAEVADKVMVMYAGRICERASTAQLMERPKHPYTIGLLQSIPKFGQRVDRLAAIPGSVPSLLDNLAGCPFHNRCSFVQDRCRKEVPQLEVAEAGHEVACFYPPQTHNLPQKKASESSENPSPSKKQEEDSDASAA